MYSGSMARGWESKAVEEQQAEAASARANPRALLSPQQRALAQEREGLLLSRQRVLQQLEAAKVPAHRVMLQQSLAALEARLSELPESS